MILTTLALCSIGLQGYVIGGEPPKPCTIEVKEERPVLANQQLINLNYDAQAWAGACLVYAQNFTGAPVANRSAWIAWQNTKLKFDKSVPLPKDVPVILWYEHWGRYDDGQGQYGSNPNDPYFGNWGHVTPFVPGRGVYTSPASGYGAERWDSIAQIESRFNSTYVGWSLDINGLQVSALDAPSPTPASPKTDKIVKRNTERTDTMYVVLNPARQDGSAAYATFREGVRGSWEEFDHTQVVGQFANALASQYGTPAQVKAKRWGELQAKYSAKKL